MTKSPKSDGVGDRQSPPLKANASALRYGVDQADFMSAEPPAKGKPIKVDVGLAHAVKSKATAPAATTCQQKLWLSFFFDGTGNNRDADLGTLKHSNVVKLYRAHQESSLKGIYRIYIPGVGTYFSEVGDPGGTTLGLGTGSKGSARLDWALAQFDEKIAYHLGLASSASSAILEVNVAVFGFSRGAALARAFTNKLIKERAYKDQKKGWCLTKGKCHLRIRFMGLFDTVASVGLPMSANTTSTSGTIFGLKKILFDRLNDSSYFAARPVYIAYAKKGKPGADPAPGVYDGHQDWGGSLLIPDMVEDVRHFIAAHEIRNSFPVDSVSILKAGKVVKPAQFHESVYPGVHSDIGGSYRPGEGAKSDDYREKLGLIPLNHMYQFAVASGVPMLIPSSTDWQAFNTQDFSVAKTLFDQFNYYQGKLPSTDSLGLMINAHMKLYFSWRFRAIRLKEGGNHQEADHIKRVDDDFKKDEAKLDKEIQLLEINHSAAVWAENEAQERRSAYIQSNYGNPNLSSLPGLDAEVADASKHESMSRDRLLRAKAKRDALPQMGKLQETISMYDRQLLADVRAIRDVYAAKGIFGGAADSAKYNDLRPHYKAMIDAYENEYIHNKGLTDKNIIFFFDNYVHDSLSGFAKDATLPSDPRVVYLGGDEKYEYAMLNKKNNDEQYQLADGSVEDDRHKVA